MNKANFWIDTLNLRKHPEGGYYKEVYRSGEKFEITTLPRRYTSDRSFSTSIYFLLKSDDFSRFHRIQSDETWHFYHGSTIELFVLGKTGKLVRHLLGKNPEFGENFQFTIKRNQWFGGKVIDKNSYALLGCTVAPGFHFDDFELADRASLIADFPQHKIILQEMTRN
jgi:predicted cupin superfamily sugar epimerase